MLQMKLNSQEITYLNISISEMQFMEDLMAHIIPMMIMDIKVAIEKLITIMMAIGETTEKTIRKTIKEISERIIEIIIKGTIEEDTLAHKENSETLVMVTVVMLQ